MWGRGMYPHMSRDRHMCMHVDMYSYVPGECLCMETRILMYMEVYMFYVGCVLCVHGSMHKHPVKGMCHIMHASCHSTLQRPCQLPAGRD